MKTNSPQLRKLLRGIGLNIKRLREQSKLTQEQLDGRGFSTRWCQYLEAGRRNINVSTLLKLAKALRVPVSELFKDL